MSWPAYWHRDRVIKFVLLMPPDRINLVFQRIMREEFMK